LGNNWQQLQIFRFVLANKSSNFSLFTHRNAENIFGKPQTFHFAFFSRYFFFSIVTHLSFFVPGFLDEFVGKIVWVLKY